LPALRIGWMFGPAHIVDACNRIRGPFNVTTRRLLAAVAAIEDSAHVQMSRTHTSSGATGDRGDRQARTQVTPERRQFRADPLPTDKGRTAAEADAYLTKVAWCCGR